MILILGPQRTATTIAYRELVCTISPTYALYEPFTFVRGRVGITHDILGPVRDDTWRLPAILREMVLRNQEWILEYLKLGRAVPLCGWDCWRIIYRLHELDNVLVKDVYFWFNALESEHLLERNLPDAVIIYTWRSFDAWFLSLMEWFRADTLFARVRNVLRKIVNTYIKRTRRPINTRIKDRVADTMRSLTNVRNPKFAHGIGVFYSYLGYDPPRRLTSETFKIMCETVHMWYTRKLEDLKRRYIHSKYELSQGYLYVLDSKPNILIVMVQDKLTDNDSIKICNIVEKLIAQHKYELKAS